MVEKKLEVLFGGLKKTKWKKMFHMYYVEPVLAVLFFSSSLSETVMSDQIIIQSCTTIFNYNKSDCEQLGTSNANHHIHEIEKEVQPFVSNLFMIRSIIQSLAPALCGMFVGSWSDYYGRKPLILISMIGFTLQHIFLTIISKVSEYYSVNPWYYIIATIPRSISGGGSVFFMGVFCFIADVTDRKTRPFRMLFLDVWDNVAMIGGLLLSSFIYNATNSTTVFFISGILLCLTTTFVIIYVPETLHLKKDESTIENNADEIDTEKNIKINLQKYIPQRISDNKDGDLKTSQDEPISKSEEESKKIGILSYVHIKEMFYTCIKPRESYDRSIIWLVTWAMIIFAFIWDGTATVFYLFVRKKFNWTMREFTFHESANDLSLLVGTFLGFVILRKICNLSVVTLALLAFCSDVISSVVRGLASESWHLYLAVGLGTFRAFSGPMCRTIICNVVPPTDLGKIYSIRNIIRTFAPFLAAPLYAFIYQHSLGTFPGLFSIVSAVLYLIGLIFISFVLHFKLKDNERYAKLLK